MSGQDSFVTMEAGDGNDVVDATLTQSGWSVALDLGAGLDEFAGEVAGDTVTTGPPGESDRDVIRGGDGSDTLISRGGPVQMYGDRSIDYLVVSSATDALIDGGAGQDEIGIGMDEGGWVVDLATGASRNGVQTHTWSSIETLDATGDIGHLQVMGTSGPTRSTSCRDAVPGPCWTSARAAGPTRSCSSATSRTRAGSAWAPAATPSTAAPAATPSTAVATHARRRSGVRAARPSVLDG